METLIAILVLLLTVLSKQALLLEHGPPTMFHVHDFRTSKYYLNISQGENASAASWEAHSEQLAECDSRQLQQLLTGKWYMDSMGHYLYEPDTCLLRRFSGDEARRCLVGRHIVFLGDSLTRYQYLSLAYFLSKLKRVEPYGDVPDSSSLNIETEWKDWSQFYQHSSSILSEAREGCATELCDCVRGGGAVRSPSNIREYRTLLLSFPGNCQSNCGQHLEPTHSLALSYQQLFAHPDAITAGRDAMKHFEHSYRQQPPDVLIVNMGHHIGSYGKTNYSDSIGEVMSNGEAVRQAHNTELLWKTTTPTVNGEFAFHDEEMKNAASHNYTLYDVGTVALAALEQGLHLYWDGAHFLPLVYTQFNDVLLNYLCL